MGLPFYADGEDGRSGGDEVYGGLPRRVHDFGVSTADAVELGVAPFLIGDAIKLVLAGAAMPAAWRLANRRS